MDSGLITTCVPSIPIRVHIEEGVDHILNGIDRNVYISKIECMLLTKDVVTKTIDSKVGIYMDIACEVMFTHMITRNGINRLERLQLQILFKVSKKYTMEWYQVIHQ